MLAGQAGWLGGRALACKCRAGKGRAGQGRRHRQDTHGRGFPSIFSNE